MAPAGDAGSPGWFTRLLEQRGGRRRHEPEAQSARVWCAAGASKPSPGPAAVAAPAGSGTEPAYQAGVQNTGYRTISDVSFDADPSTGVAGLRLVQ